LKTFQFTIENNWLHSCNCNYLFTGVNSRGRRTQKIVQVRNTYFNDFRPPQMSLLRFITKLNHHWQNNLWKVHKSSLSWNHWSIIIKIEPYVVVFKLYYSCYNVLNYYFMWFSHKYFIIWCIRNFEIIYLFNYQINI